MNNSQIKNLFEGIANALKPTSSISSFAYGLYQDINATSERPYPLLWLESDIQFTGNVAPDDSQTQDARVALVLLDQLNIKPDAEGFADQVAQVKTKLMETWQAVWSALIAVRQNKTADWEVFGGYNALSLDMVNNDMLYGYRIEFTIRQIVTPNDCLFQELTGTVVYNISLCN